MWEDKSDGQGLQKTGKQVDQQDQNDEGSGSPLAGEQGVAGDQKCLEHGQESCGTEDVGQRVIDGGKKGEGKGIEQPAVNSFLSTEC